MKISNEMKDKLLKPGHAFTAKDLREVGLSWPPQKGWKRVLMKELGLQAEKRRRRFEAKKKSKIASNDYLQNGYVIRKTGTGKTHYLINGQTLCRRKITQKLARTTIKPKAPICSTCEHLKETDPHNVRQTKKVQEDFYRSWEWKKVRFETIKRYGAVCMCCGSDYRIVVDHIKPRMKYPSLELDPDNLQVLCNECNMGKSNDDETDFRPDGDELTNAELQELDLLSDSDRHLH